LACFPDSSAWFLKEDFFIMKLWDSVKKMFVSPTKQESVNSRAQARDRLRLVLVHDRDTISPVMMDKLKEELLQTLSQYMQVDEVMSVARLEQTDKEVRLVATFPIVKINRNYAENIS
jgi:cell division topological specificity factor